MKFDKFPYPGKNILVVEDNICNQELMADMIEALDCKQDIASSGLEAIKKWETSKYDLIILDIHMPNMDGYEVSETIRRLENNKTHIPILALTASALSTEREKCFEKGMDDYLSKPINIDLLEAKLKEMFTKFQPFLQS